MCALEYAIDVGGTKIAFAIVDGAHLLAHDARPTSGESAQSQMEAIGPLLAEMARQLGVAPKAIGISLPGPVLAGTLAHAPNMPPGWIGSTVGDFSRWLDLQAPVVAQRDALMGGLGEYAFGAGRGRFTFAYLTLGTGIGGGLIVDGQPLLGKNGAAGEIGHLSVSRTGPRCSCGRLGCVEAMASGTAIAKQYLAKSRKALDAAAVAARARAGDRLAQVVYRQAGEALGAGLAAWAQVANPELVVVGGSLAQSLDLLRPGMERVLNKRAWAANLPLPIVPAELGGPAPLIGAAWAAHQAVVTGRTT